MFKVLNIFNALNQVEGEGVYAVRTVYGFCSVRTIDGEAIPPLLEILCKNDYDQAIPDDAYRGINLLDRDRLKSLCSRIYKSELFQDQDKDFQSSKDFEYWSNYLSQKVCKLAQKSWWIISNKDLFNVLYELLDEHRDLSKYYTNMGSNVKYIGSKVKWFIERIE